MNPAPFRTLSAIMILVCLTMVAPATNLQFEPPAGMENLRTRELFDAGWRFQRFGLQADGERLEEPGVVSWLASVTASTEEAAQGNIAKNAFDGDLATRWCASSSAPNQWLQLELQEVDGIADVKITWETNGTYTAVIEGSDDGLTWKTVAPTAEAPVRQPFLRIRTTAVPGSYWASIREVALTDTKGQPVTQRQVSSPGDPPQNVAHPDWRKLDLPHDWGIEGPFRLDLDGKTAKLPWKGIGWYEKAFSLPATDKGKQVFLDFDGAMAHAKVWINGNELPARPYGYTAFRVNLTPHLEFGGENLISVRLDTESWDSRWYPGAGIYRHTWLVKTGPLHVAHYGTTINTLALMADRATVEVVVRLSGYSAESDAARKILVQTTLHELGADDAVGEAVAEGAGEIGSGHGATEPGMVTAAVNLTFAKPKVWDLTSPQRYLARVIVTADGLPVDVYDTPFGIRLLEFSPRDGFILNGKRVPIRGACQHHDLGALGAALNDRALQRQLEILQGMGVNAIRTTHNPPAPELLDLADKMGLLVQVEAFDCWATGKLPNDYSRLYPKWHEADLRDMVRQNRNHPSVFMWSIGNEVVEQDKPEFPRALAEIIKSEDSTRPVTIGLHNPQKAAESGFIGALDVMGVNYNPAYYATFLADESFVDKAIYGSETSSCLSSRGEYFFPVARGRDSQVNFQVSSYDVDAPSWAYPPDDQFRALHRHPEVMGEFVWTGFDYLGEPAPYDGDADTLPNFSGKPEMQSALETQLKETGKFTVPSRSTYFGAIDLAGFPKDRYYLYQGQWRKDLPMAHLLPHWNWPERVGQITPVHLYTSGDEAELFVNGKSQGRRKLEPGECRLRWDEVIYAPGEIRTVVYKSGKEWAKDTVKTTGAASKLALAADRAGIRNDGRDLSFITARITDDKGLTVPRSHHAIRFSVEGPGEIVATDNGDATSFEAFQSPNRKAFNGLALVIVRAKAGQSGEIQLKAESDGLKAATITLRGGK